MDDGVGLWQVQTHPAGFEALRPGSGKNELA
jgi:hypothetical protein